MYSEPIGEIQMGDVAKDTITGFEGRVVGITDWIYQCRRLGIQPMKLTKEGNPPDIQWFDELQCKLVKNKTERRGKDKGGPMPKPTRNKDP